MEIYNSKYYRLDFSPEQELIEWTCKPTTIEMQEKEYKQELLNCLDNILKTPSRKLLADTRDLLFVVVPALQEWTNERFFKPIIENKEANKVAFVVSKDLFSRVSIEQAMEEAEGNKFPTRYFDNIEDAKEWLLYS